MKDLGLWDFLNPDYLEKAHLAYREHCIKGKECETVKRICVNEKWCRSSDVEDGSIAWDDNIYKIYIESSSKNLQRLE